MNNTQTESIARGSEQRYWWARMTEGADGCPNPARLLRGKAKQYSDKYVRSFRNMMQRAKAAGYTIERTPGPRGGEWGANYVARKEQSA